MAVVRAAHRKDQPDFQEFQVDPCLCCMVHIVQLGIRTYHLRTDLLHPGLENSSDSHLDNDRVRNIFLRFLLSTQNQPKHEQTLLVQSIKWRTNLQTNGAKCT